MPKRLTPYVDVPAPANHESFEPYWTSILVIVMATFALFGVQSITTAVQEEGAEEVTSCFMQSKESAYNRFVTCTSLKS